MGAFNRYLDVWNKKCVEPVKRNKDGVQWISHRFPIKGGISPREAMIRDLCEPNPLFNLVCKGGPDPLGVMVT